MGCSKSCRYQGHGVGTQRNRHILSEIFPVKTFYGKRGVTFYRGIVNPKLSLPYNAMLWLQVMSGAAGRQTRLKVRRGLAGVALRKLDLTPLPLQPGVLCIRRMQPVDRQHVPVADVGHGQRGRCLALLLCRQNLMPHCTAEHTLWRRNDAVVSLFFCYFPS